MLRGNEGRFWEVSVAIDNLDPDDGGYFTDGWESFVLDNCIVKGETLKVYYATFGTFYVRIFAEDGNERLPAA